MKRSEIEKHLANADYKIALEKLSDYGPSVWRDTAELRCLRALGQRHEALRLAEKFARESNLVGDPERNDRARYIALVLTEQGQAKRACEIMADLCLKSPNVPALYREYAFSLATDLRLDEAEYNLRKAISLRPTNASSHAQLARVYCRTGRVDKGIKSYFRAAILDPDKENFLQRLAYWTNFVDSTTQQSNYQLARLWAAKAHPTSTANAKTEHIANPDKVLKLGFVSGDFCSHAISFFIFPLFKGLDRRSFSITAYNDTRKIDKVTGAIRDLCDFWHESSKLTDSELAAQVETDQIDILVDLSGHKGTNRMGMFAKQSAPIQLSWLGYPSTTGLDSIQYRITDQIADPKGPADKYFSEQLLRLENGFLCYEPLATAPDITERAADSPICFGSFNNLAKISSLTLDCWAAVLRAVPNSILYLKRQQLVNQSAQEYLIHEFKLRGVRPDRLRLKTSKAKIEQHLDEYNEIDIALDTTPYNGATATLEALWMGKPVITLSGNTHASRVSASILNRLELDDLVCHSVDEYALAAAKLAADSQLLRDVRSSLRSRMAQSALTNKMQFGHEFGEALRTVWQQWCRRTDTIDENVRAVGKPN